MEMGENSLTEGLMKLGLQKISGGISERFDIVREESPETRLLVGSYATGPREDDGGTYTVQPMYVEKGTTGDAWEIKIDPKQKDLPNARIRIFPSPDNNNELRVSVAEGIYLDGPKPEEKIVSPDEWTRFSLKYRKVFESLAKARASRLQGK